MRNGWLSLLGLVLMLPLLVGTLQGNVTLEVTAIRVAVLVVSLIVLDRAIVPACRLFIALFLADPERNGSSGERKLTGSSGERKLTDANGEPMGSSGAPDAAAAEAAR